MSKKETNKEEPLKTFLQDRFDDYRHPVRDDLWSTIEQDLFEKKKAFPIKKTLFISVAVAASLILAFLAIPSFENENPVVVNKSDVPASLATPSSVKQEVVDDVVEASISTKPTLLANVSKVKSDKKVEGKIASLDSLVVIDKTDVKTVNTYDVRSDSTTNRSENKKPKYTDLNLPNDEWIDPIAKRKSSKLSFALMAMGTLNEKNQSDDLMRYVTQTDEGVVNRTAKYDQPINLGFLVRKNLTKRISLETGLSYTYLSSKETNKYKEGAEKQKKIKLHYLGIPLKVNYTIYEDRSLAVYASAGGMVEKSVSGSQEIINGQRADKEDLDVSELQWSLAGAVGAQYKLTKNWGVFVEPGVGYFFDDNSGVATIRKDKKLIFNVQGGIRFSY